MGNVQHQDEIKSTYFTTYQSVISMQYQWSQTITLVSYIINLRWKRDKLFLFASELKTKTRKKNRRRLIEVFKICFNEYLLHPLLLINFRFSQSYNKRLGNTTELYNLLVLTQQASRHVKRPRKLFSGLSSNSIEVDIAFNLSSRRRQNKNLLFSQNVVVDFSHHQSSDLTLKLQMSMIVICMVASWQTRCHVVKMKLGKDQ